MRTRILSGIFLFTFVAFSVTAFGATFFVNSYADFSDSTPDAVCDDGTGHCSLREAIQEANALAGLDTIYLPPGTYEMTIGGSNEDGCLTGDLDIFDDVSIIGIQATRIESQVGRVMHIISGNVSMTGLTMAEGDGAVETGSQEAGGAVYNGGGILTLNNCTMTTNQAKKGGGVFNNAGGTLAINGSTLILNSAQGSTDGGGVYNLGTMIVTNSTIHNNSATGFGGGVFNAGGTLTLNNVTITENAAGGSNDGGGIATSGGTVNISNTILANNIASGPNDDCFGILVSSGYNIVEDIDGCTGLVATDITLTDPMLGPLQNNGGLTLTQLPLVGSIAVEGGDPTAGVCEDLDQRGLARPQGTFCDIGAVEVFPNCPVITLSPDVLPTILPGQYFTQTITASGGVAPYTFAVTAGSLPAGLALDPLTGIISGVPLEGGSYSFTITAFDSNFCPGSITYSYSCPLITLTPLLLPDATQGNNYSQTISATGGAAPYIYSISAGFLPPGMTLNPTTGEISGSPDVPGAFFFVVMATDSLLCTGVQPYTLIVECVLTLDPSTLPDGIEGVFYSQQLIATGGNGGPYTFSVPSGTLPPGITLSGSGLLSGTPTAIGDYTFIVEATDGFNCTGTIFYTLRINPCIVISPDTLPVAEVGVAYNQTLTATGGNPPITFSVTAGSLPNGITLSSDGVLSGTPDTEGVYSFEVTANDSGVCVVTKSYILIVSPGGCPLITISPAVLVNGTEGVPYSEDLDASGGSPSYTFLIAGGSLPPGLALDPTSGAVTGTPTTPGIFTFTVAAVDSNFCAGVQTYTVLISPSGCPTITLAPPTLPDGAVGTAYAQTITASGGAPPYTFSVIAGALPDGLTLTPSTGEITGVPTTQGTFNFTIAAVDAALCFGSQSYTVTITGGSTCALFNDDFSDDVVDWLVEKPAWVETGGNLIGTPIGRKATINASGLFAGCTGTCSFRSTMTTAGGAFNRVWMLAWYADKRNTIEVLMKEENDKFVLKQKVGGIVVAKTKGLIQIDPNVIYDVQVAFDGTQFNLIVNGNSIATLNAAKQPSGTAAFQVKNTTGTFGNMCVN